MTSEWSSVDAARSIPCDSMPRNFRGTRFVRTIIFLPLRSSVE